MRWSILGLLLVAACAAHPPPSVALAVASPTAVIVDPPETGEPPATGVVEGHAFVARSALMLMKNAPGRNCPWVGFVLGCSDPTGYSSFIRIYDHPVTCADVRLLDTGIREAPLGDDERTVFVQIEGAWPPAPGTRTTKHVTVPADNLYISYARGDNGVTGLEGTMEVVKATTNTGVIWFDLVKKNLFSRDTFTGAVGVTVCR